MINVICFGNITSYILKYHLETFNQTSYLKQKRKSEKEKRKPFLSWLGDNQEKGIGINKELWGLTYVYAEVFFLIFVGIWEVN